MQPQVKTNPAIKQSSRTTLNCELQRKTKTWQLNYVVAVKKSHFEMAFIQQLQKEEI